MAGIQQSPTNHNIPNSILQPTADNINQILNFRQSIFFKISALVALLTLAGGDSPFDTHPAAMAVALAASLTFYLASSGQLRFSLGPFTTDSLMVLSGNASVASLASVITPALVRPLLYAGPVLISSSEFLPWMFRRILDATASVGFLIYAVSVLISATAFRRTLDATGRVRRRIVRVFVRPRPILPLTQP